MTQGEMLKIMADTVAEYQNCMLEVVMGEDTAVAHIIPLYAEEDEDDEED